MRKSLEKNEDQLHAVKVQLFFTRLEKKKAAPLILSGSFESKHDPNLKPHTDMCPLCQVSEKRACSVAVLHPVH